MKIRRMIALVLTFVIAYDLDTIKVFCGSTIKSMKVYHYKYSMNYEV